MIREVVWQKAVEELQQGQIVALPTETVYGLGASVEHESALQEIFRTKGRPSFDPLIVHVSSLAQAKSLVKIWPPVADKLALEFWPGALTLILKKKDHISMTITAGLKTVGIRLPSHPIMRSIIENLGAPIAAPSANRFKRTSPTTVAHVRTEFPDADFAIVNGGPSEVGIESTIVSLGEDRIEILRLGMISKSEIEKVVGRPVSILESDAALGLAPGTLREHYQTSKPLYLLSETEIPSGILQQKFFEISLPSDPFAAARTLYSKMREADLSEAELLIVRKTALHDGPYWDAIWDRLSRAASKI